MNRARYLYPGIRDQNVRRHCLGASSGSGRHGPLSSWSIGCRCGPKRKYLHQHPCHPRLQGTSPALRACQTLRFGQHLKTLLLCRLRRRRWILTVARHSDQYHALYYVACTSNFHHDSDNAQERPLRAPELGLDDIVAPISRNRNGYETKP